MSLQPKPGFNWQAVSWGGPDEPPPTECSYCDAALPENGTPLMLHNNAGWAAYFCDGCMVTWWGIRLIRPLPEEDDW